MRTRSRTYHSEWTDELREEGAVREIRVDLVLLLAGTPEGLGDRERERIEPCDDLQRL